MKGGVVMQTQQRLSLERCRELIGNKQQYSDDELTSIRDRLYSLAELVLQKYEKIRSFFTQTKTIAARAMIVK